MLRKLDLIEERLIPKHADVDRFFQKPIQGRKELLKYTAKRILRPPSSQNIPYMFCFVRNPLSWYESWFKYMKQPSRQWRSWGDEKDPYKWHPNSMLNGLGHCDFSEFVKNVNKNRPGYVTELFSWYTRPQMGFVGKQESLVDDLISVLNVMNLGFDEQLIRDHEKVGVSPESEVIWPAELKIETALLEYAGLARYGYQQSLTSLGLGISESDK